MSIEQINPDISIEELVEKHPLSVRFLMEKGIRCLRCGEPIWGTLKDAALEKGYSDHSIPDLVEELKEYVKES